jgi:hypothetical protein
MNTTITDFRLACECRDFMPPAVRRRMVRLTSSGCEVYESGATEIAKALNSNTAITALDLSKQSKFSERWRAASALV